MRKAVLPKRRRKAPSPLTGKQLRGFDLLSSGYDRNARCKGNGCEGGVIALIQDVGSQAVQAVIERVDGQGQSARSRSLPASRNLLSLSNIQLVTESSRMAGILLGERR